MVISTDSVLDLADIDITDLSVREYGDATIYGDVESEIVLHEGSVRVLANGWIELPTGRLLSPAAVHHIDDKSASES